MAAKTTFFINTADTLSINISVETLIYGEEVMLCIVLVYFFKIHKSNKTTIQAENKKCICILIEPVFTHQVNVVVWPSSLLGVCSPMKYDTGA